MLLKVAILCIVCAPLYSVNVDEYKFNYLIDTELHSIDDAKELIFDSFDEYTYYFLMGKQAAFEHSREIFQECIE